LHLELTLTCLLPQTLKNYSGSVKDLKQLLEIDRKNSAALAELEEVKKLWEKQLREVQASLQARRESPEGNKSSKVTQKEKKGTDKERKTDTDRMQREKLSKILAAAQSSLEELKKESTQRQQSPSKPSPTLGRSRNSSQRQPNSGHTPDSASSTTGKKGKRRKVMVEEVGGKTNAGLHRLASQPAPQENRPVSKKQEKSEAHHKNSPLEKKQARVLTKEMMGMAQGENTRLETERIKKALAEKEKELESKRAFEGKEKVAGGEKQKRSTTGKSSSKENKVKQESWQGKREKLSTPDGAKVRLQESNKTEIPVELKDPAIPEKEMLKSSVEDSAKKTPMLLVSTRIV